jgi:PilZ domain
MTTLSVNGCTIEFSPSLDLRHNVELHLQLPNQTRPLVIRCAAIRWVRDSSYGLQFLAINNWEQLNSCVIEELAHAVSDAQESRNP